MNKNNILVSIIMLVVGFGLGYLLKGGNATTDHVMTMDSMMESMTADLENKTGDEFDQAFINGMIVHHEGAVAMAQRALESAKHAEIKILANAIISAQTSEIAQMQNWMKSWYGTNSAEGAPEGSIHNLPVPVGVSAAKKALAGELKIDENKVVIMTAFEKEWSDSCLGLGGPAESCLQAITPGYEVAMQAQGKTYVYRTSADGTSVRKEK